jgi:hypothetical protein
MSGRFLLGFSLLALTATDLYGTIITADPPTLGAGIFTGYAVFKNDVCGGLPCTSTTGVADLYAKDYFGLDTTVVLLGTDVRNGGSVAAGSKQAFTFSASYTNSPFFASTYYVVYTIGYVCEDGSQGKEQTPEPGTLGLLAAGLLVLAARHFRR